MSDRIQWITAAYDSNGLLLLKIITRTIIRIADGAYLINEKQNDYT